MATRARSPNYPATSLPKAIELARKVYERNHLHKASPDVVASALGYTTLNGSSASVISALKKYGLLEEVGKDLKITEDALSILVDPPGSADRARRIAKAALLPALFAAVAEEYPGAPPNDEILRSFLLRSGFVQSTVDVPIRAYRETMELVERERAFYNDGSAKKSAASPPAEPETPSVETEPIKIGDLVQWESGGVLRMDAPRIVRAIQDGWAFVEGSETGIPVEELLLEQRGVAGLSKAAPPKLALPTVEERPEQGEKEWLRGPLSKATSYRLIVSGNVGSREIGKLIRLLEAQKLVLEDEDEQDESDLA
jgi:hypothetical protein